MSFFLRQFLLGISNINLFGKPLDVQNIVSEVDDAIKVNKSVQPNVAYKRMFLYRYVGMTFATLWFMGGLVGSLFLVPDVLPCVFITLSSVIPLLCGHIYAYFFE